MKQTSKQSGQDGETQPIGVVDIGSNSVRLLIYDVASLNPVPLFNEKVLCGLGRELASTGRMCDESMARAIDAMKRFRAIATQLNTRKLHIIATAAVREASNADDFVARAEDACGTQISILSGKEEAELAANGVISGFAEADGLAGDMGGGSLELMDIKKRKLSKFSSLPLGGLRLIDISKSNVKASTKFIDSELEKVSWLKNGKDRPFYAIGGAWRAFARLHMAHTRYPLRVMHGYKIAMNEALEFAHLMDHLSPSSMQGIQSIAKARRETVPYGALVLERLFKIVRPSEFIISSYGVREGVLFSLLSKEEQRTDPLLNGCAGIARLRARSAEYCQELCQWTDSLFQSSDLSETAQEKRLRHAACLLSDIGWRIHPEYRSKQSLNNIAHATFTGVDHPGRAFLALTISYRYGGPKKHINPPRLVQLIDEKMDDRARILGAAIRVAHDISASAPGVIANTPLLYKEGRLVLDLSSPYHILRGERLTQRLEFLGNLLNLEVEIKTGKGGAPSK